MSVLHADELTMLRGEGHRSSFYASFLKPLTLWEMQVNSGALTRGETTIPFNNGTGSHFAAVETPQEVWIGTTQGSNSIEHRMRVRSITSGDGGVTGTIEVSPNVVIWADDLWIRIAHNYPLSPMYTLLVGPPSSASIFIDRDVAYTDQNSQPPPVVVVEFSHRAGFIRNGEATFWVDASNSYAIANGATISSYALTTYPTAGVSITFNTSTGIGRIIATSLTQDYYWCKFSVTDSNGKTQDSWRCIFAYDPDRDGGVTYPHIDFSINQLNSDWNRGGWYGQLLLHDNATLADVPDKTFAILWQEQSWGIDEDFALSYRFFNKLFVNPRIYSTSVPNGANCDVTAFITVGVMVEGQPAVDGTDVNIDLYIQGDAPTALNGTTTDGKITLSTTFVNKACTGTLIAETSDNLVELVRRSYTRTSTSEVPDYPSTMLAFPQPLITGYLRKENIQRGLAPSGGASVDTFEITTIEHLLKNEYAYSVPVEAVQGTPSGWHEYEDWLTVGRIIHHLFRWHSTLLEIADVIGLLNNTVGRYAADFDAGSLYSMADNMAYRNGIRSHFVTNKRGQFCLHEDQQLMLDADRAAITSKATLTFEDGSAEFGILREVPYRVVLVYLSGMKFLATFHTSTQAETSGQLVPDVEAYCALAPGALAGGEGAKPLTVERQTLASQAEANAVAGRHFAAENNILPEFRWTFPGNYLSAFDFDEDEWWEIDINVVDTIRQIAWPDTNLIFRGITANISVEDGVMEMHANFEPEATGIDGVTTECPEPTDLGGDTIVIDIEFLSNLPGGIITASA